MEDYFTSWSKKLQQFNNNSDKIWTVTLCHGNVKISIIHTSFEMNMKYF